MWSAFLVRCYMPLEVRARRVLLPFPPAHEDLASLSELAPEVDWHVPQRGSKAQLAELADQNARHLLDSLKIESFDIDERAADPVFALGRDLGLAAVPRAFVCIDISTNQGRDTVGSLVWFEGGRPKKAEYRRFKIRCAPQDDFAAVHEVVTRYLTRRIAENKPLPDLMVIDGGKGQLGAALDAARAAGRPELPIVSLAKREEEVFLPARVDPLALSRRSPSLKLLQRARAEARGPSAAAGASLDHVALPGVVAPHRWGGAGHTGRGRDAAALGAPARREARLSRPAGEGRRSEPHGLVQSPRTRRRRDSCRARGRQAAGRAHGRKRRPGAPGPRRPPRPRRPPLRPRPHPPPPPRPD